ncbi:RHS repeat protein [Oxalobacteraceae sp. CFBP 13730]|nr:RHS repeat protein [Oxalobacteraceae sp. CFBP 13730]
MKINKISELRGNILIKKLESRHFAYKFSICFFVLFFSFKNVVAQNIVEIRAARPLSSISFNGILDSLDKTDRRPQTILQPPPYPHAQPGTGAPAPRSTCDDDSLPPSIPISTNPVVLSTGEKYIKQEDFPSSSMLGLSLTRTYKSGISGSFFFGPQWTSSIEYDYLWMSGNYRPYRINGVAVNLPDYMTFKLPDGTTYHFVHILDAAATSPLYALSVDSKNSTGTGLIVARYLDPTHISVRMGSREYLYSSKTPGAIAVGLDSIKENGKTIYTYYRDMSDRVVEITNALGAKIRLEWEGSVSRIIAPDGGVWNYKYNTNGLLTTVVPPNSTVGTYTYFYEDSKNNKLLTGFAIDGVRRTRYAYDSTGKVIRSGTENGEAVDTFSYTENSTILTDVRGQRTVYNFQTVKGQKVLANTQTTATAYCPNATATQSYDSLGFLAESTDFRGMKTKYSYTNDGWLLSKTIASGTDEAQTVTNSYVQVRSNATPEVIKKLVTGADGNGILQVDYTYVDTLAGRQISTMTATDLIEGSPQRKQVISYSSHANGGIQSKTISTVINEGQSNETFNFDSMGNLSAHINAIGHVTSYEDNNGLGLPRYIRDPNGVMTKLDYDGRGNLIFEFTTGRAINKFSYAGDGQLLSLLSSNGYARYYSYNSSGRLAEISDQAGRKKRFHFDVVSNTRTTQSPRDLPSFSAGMLSAVSAAEPFSSTTVYDYALNLPTRIHGNHGQLKSLFYDANGNLVSISDAAGKVSSYTYGVLNKPAMITAADGGQIVMNYNPAGRLSSVRDSRGLTTRYAYNGFGDRIRTNSPDTGTTSYTYDKAGKLKTEIFADGRVATYIWDVLGRLLSKSIGGSTNTYTYDEGAFGKGLLTRMQDQTGQTVYSYGPNGELLRQTNYVFDQVFNTTWTYDDTGRKETMTYPSGMMLKYTYDAAGKVSAIKSNGIK